MVFGECFQLFQCVFSNKCEQSCDAMKLLDFVFKTTNKMCLWSELIKTVPVVIFVVMVGVKPNYKLLQTQCFKLAIFGLRCI